MAINQKHLKEYLLEQGASLVGFADLTELTEGDLKNGMSIIIRLPKHIIRNINGGPTREYFNMYHEINGRLDLLAHQCEQYIRDCGYHATALTTDIVKTSDDHRTKIPHKTVATNGGLGWIGKCALLVTKEYGSAVRLTSVLTDAPFQADSPVTDSLCGNCMRCTEACPGKAVSGRNWNRELDRDMLLNAEECRRSARVLAKERIQEVITLCGKCIEICPYTRKYIYEDMKQEPKN
ncbi:MAG TPA: epoxyqueuosine reductase [Candidatus Pelethocola excrementipullorum]|nr:epoxyqueuosine reductase [Candidatus Pelethocola excrementipullorum]